MSRRGQPGTPKSETQKQKQKERMLQYWSSEEGQRMRSLCGEAAKQRVLTEEASKNIRKSQSSEYYGFVSPEGDLLEPIVDLKHFCKVHKLHVTSMINLFKGKKEQYKGWTVNHTIKYQRRYGREVK